MLMLLPGHPLRSSSSRGQQQQQQQQQHHQKQRLYQTQQQRFADEDQLTWMVSMLAAV